MAAKASIAARTSRKPTGLIASFVTDISAHVRQARKRLKLSQEEAGRIIGGGKRAFQKYESGAMPPSDAAVGLIELLIRHPEEVETLRAIRAGG